MRTNGNKIVFTLLIATMLAGGPAMAQSTDAARGTDVGAKTGAFVRTTPTTSAATGGVSGSSTGASSGASAAAPSAVYNASRGGGAPVFLNTSPVERMPSPIATGRTYGMQSVTVGAGAGGEDVDANRRAADEAIEQMRRSQSARVSQLQAQFAAEDKAREQAAAQNKNQRTNTGGAQAAQPQSGSVVFVKPPVAKDDGVPKRLFNVPR